MPNSPTVEIVDVTPEIAEAWLSKNPNNRNLRGQVIASYARDMASGSWVLNGETVKISVSGHLLDGQHRLSAVVEAAVTVPMIVVNGIPSEAMPTVDTGAKRTYADSLRLQGEENTSVLAAVTRRRAPLGARLPNEDRFHDADRTRAECIPGREPAPTNLRRGGREDRLPHAPAC